MVLRPVEADGSALVSMTAARTEQSPAPGVTSQTPSPGLASAPSVVVLTVNVSPGGSHATSAVAPRHDSTTAASPARRTLPQLAMVASPNRPGTQRRTHP